MWLGGLRLTGAALHWLVMGTLEIAATAIPALVAFGAAIAGMAPTFIHISDQMNFLRTATGSWRGALLNSVGPLHQVGLGMGQLSQAMAPDAYIIFGAAINGLAGHMSLFSGVAQRAGGVLAAFATKLSAEFAPGGALSSQFAAFFTYGVKYMIQWGQVIGNLAHAFFNAASSMWGIGQALLDVLNLISRAFLAITSNPVGAVFIGIAAGMSAVYRYGLLLMKIWTWIGGAAVVTAVRTIAVGDDHRRRGDRRPIGGPHGPPGEPDAADRQPGRHRHRGHRGRPGYLVAGEPAGHGLDERADSAGPVRDAHRDEPRAGHRHPHGRPRQGRDGIKAASDYAHDRSGCLQGAGSHRRHHGRGDVTKLEQALSQQALKLINLETGLGAGRACGPGRSAPAWRPWPSRQRSRTLRSSS